MAIKPKGSYLFKAVQQQTLQDRPELYLAGKIKTPAILPGSR